jgi:hypothetical protein
MTVLTCPLWVWASIAESLQALMQLDRSSIGQHELSGNRYGQSKAAALLNYKKKHGIVNLRYRKHADNIVGKMTIASLDGEVAQREKGTQVVVEAISCRFDSAHDGIGPESDGS